MTRVIEGSLYESGAGSSGSGSSTAGADNRSVASTRELLRRAAVFLNDHEKTALRYSNFDSGTVQNVNDVTAPLNEFHSEDLNADTNDNAKVNSKPPKTQQKGHSRRVLKRRRVL